MTIIRAGPRGFVYGGGGGGALKAKGLQRAVQVASGRECERRLTRIFFSNLCLCECISSHFEAHFSIFYNLNFK